MQMAQGSATNERLAIADELVIIITNGPRKHDKRTPKSLSPKIVAGVYAACATVLTR
jgi:hypothetical protein